jgi:hypothetical protein
MNINPIKSTTVLTETDEAGRLNHQTPRRWLRRVVAGLALTGAVLGTASLPSANATAPRSTTVGPCSLSVATPYRSGDYIYTRATVTCTGSHKLFSGVSQQQYYGGIWHTVGTYPNGVSYGSSVTRTSYVHCTAPFTAYSFRGFGFLGVDDGAVQLPYTGTVTLTC